MTSRRKISGHGFLLLALSFIIFVFYSKSNDESENSTNSLNKNLAHKPIIRREIPDKLVVFAFDDGTSSNYSFAAPLLKQYGFNATFYICEFPPNYKDSSIYMNWRQIRQLDRWGFEIGNHGRTHTIKKRLGIKAYKDELIFIEKKCDSMNIEKPTTFGHVAYGTDSSAIGVLKETKYAFAKSGGSRPYDPEKDSPYLIPSWSPTYKNKRQIYNALKKAENGKIVVLTFHGVPDIEHPQASVPPEMFKEYLKYLSENHYDVIALRDLNYYVDSQQAQCLIRPDFNKRLITYGMSNTQRFFSSVKGSLSKYYHSIKK